MSMIIENDYIREPLPFYGFERILGEDSQAKVINLFTTKELYDDLKNTEAVIYRCFNYSLEEFNEIIKKHSSKVTFDPARKASTSNTAEINAGIFEMGLHQENGNLPFNPDLQWFYCLEAATKGSETTLCDGQKVLFELPKEIRKMFEERNIRYTRRIPWANVQRFLSIELEIPVEKIDDSHLYQVNEIIEGQEYHRIDKNLISSSFTTSAISISPLSGKRSFCNSILGPSVNYEPPKITWDNGEEIDLDIWDIVKEITAKNTYKHFWNKGDIIVIDNKRVMHGRCALEDTQRRIFGAQSYIKGI